MSVLCLNVSRLRMCAFGVCLKIAISSKLARCLIQRQNSRYFWCPVWKTKSW